MALEDGMSEGFSGFARKARELLDGTSSLEDIEDYRELLCTDCAFYHHGEEENEECGCFLLLKALLEKGAFDLEKALRELE
jgi:predicted metal-binding protein